MKDKPTEASLSERAAACERAAIVAEMGADRALTKEERRRHLTEARRERKWAERYRSQAAALRGS